MATCDKLIFLNEEEIYIEYIDNDSKNIKKVVNFKNWIIKQRKSSVFN